MVKKCILLEGSKTYEKYNTCDKRKSKKEAYLFKVGRQWALFVGNKQVGRTTNKKSALKRLNKFCKC